MRAGCGETLRCRSPCFTTNWGNLDIHVNLRAAPEIKTTAVKMKTTVKFQNLHRPENDAQIKHPRKTRFKGKF